MPSQTDRPSAKVTSSIRPLLKIPQVAEIYGVSEKTIQRWIKKGDLKIVQLGRLVRVEPAEVERRIRDNRS